MSKSSRNLKGENQENQVSVNYAQQNSTTLGILISIVIAIKEGKKGNDNVGVA